MRKRAKTLSHTVQIVPEESGGLDRSVSTTAAPNFSRLSTAPDMNHPDFDLTAPSDEEFDVCPPNQACFSWFKSVWTAIIVCVYITFEKFCFTGIQTLVSIYLVINHGVSETNSTIICHVMLAISYFFTLGCAVLADNNIGRLPTIIISSCFYAFGNGLLVLTSILLPPLGVLMLSMVLIAIGSGGIKACLSAFAADQLKERRTTESGQQLLLEANEKTTSYLFALLYCLVNVASFFATLALPIIRKEVDCSALTKESAGGCYPLAFGITTASFVIGFLSFLLASRYYVKEEVLTPVVTQCVRCIWQALVRSLRARMQPTDGIETATSAKKKKTRFLDYAIDENNFDHVFVAELRQVLKLVLIFATFPMFWTMYEQQMTRWLFQARQMDGRLFGSYETVIKPEQMISINVLCCVVGIPLTNWLLYPNLKRLGLMEKLSTRMVFGYVLAIISFAYSGGLQYFIDQGLRGALADPNLSKLRLFSQINETAAPFTYVICPASPGQHCHQSNFSFDNPSTIVVPNGWFTLNVTTRSADASQLVAVYNERILLSGNTLSARFFGREPAVVGKVTLSPSVFDSVDAQLCLVKPDGASPSTVRVTSRSQSSKVFSSGCLALSGGFYTVQLWRNATLVAQLDNVELPLATSHIVIDAVSDSSTAMPLFVVSRGATISLFHQMPQILIITFAEIFFSISSIAFAYFEAPPAMKSVMLAVNTLNMFTGNLLVIVFTYILNAMDLSNWLQYVVVACVGLVNVFLTIFTFQRYERGEEPISDSTTDQCAEQTSPHGHKSSQSFASSYQSIMSQGLNFTYTSHLASSDANIGSIHLTRSSSFIQTP